MSDAKELLPCPFCAGLLLDTASGLLHPDNGCVIAGIYVQPDAWNYRALLAQAPPVNSVSEDSCITDELRGTRLVGPHGGLKGTMPSPTEADLTDPLFEVIWQATKRWDVNVPEYYVGYCGMNGSHVMLILSALRQSFAQAPGMVSVPRETVKFIINALYRKDNIDSHKFAAELEAMLSAPGAKKEGE